jgi:uncharacterized protein (TIGR04255 family)
MSSAQDLLPEFSSPPVVEVVLDIQFKPIEGLRVPRLGLLWQRFRDRFPHVEEQSPLERRTEPIATRSPMSANIRLELLDAPIVPRLWFMNQAGTELIQVQRDRFVYNWRKVGNGEYPRYRRVRNAFAEEIALFRQFLQEEHLDDIVPDLCEILYVNHIVADSGWQRHGEIGWVIKAWEGPAPGEFLPEPDSVRVQASYRMPPHDPKASGRLTVTLKPGVRPEDGKPMFIMTLSALGKPAGSAVEDAFQFLDRGHDWIVRGFASMTTPEMHQIWGRTR